MQKTIPRGTLLFHGSPEPEIQNLTQATELRHGGDRVFWAAFSSAIAQCYIPEAGSSIYTRLDSFIEPDCNGDISAITRFQQANGLFFDNVTWHGSRPQSFRIRKTPELEAKIGEIRGSAASGRYDWEETQKAMLQIFRKGLEDLGYTIQADGHNLAYARCILKTDFHKSGDDPQKRALWEIKPANWHLEGRLLILRTTREIELCDIASQKEGCLLEPDHLKYGLFQKAAETKDAILINDFAQIGRNHDNFGHQALGFLHNPGDTLEILANIPATHPRNFWENHYRSNNYESPEYQTWATSQTRPKAA